MFIAKDKEGNCVTIEEAVQAGEYFCPLCGGALIVKAKSSEAVSAHFAHKSRRECDSWHYDMSEWHREWQNYFPKECQEVPVQKDGVKHRADVLINNTVIEFQHSPIKAEEIAERNRFYTECGYKVVWVFDAVGKIKNEFNDTIDPLLCDETDLRWKRAKQEFFLKIPENVTIYLQYRTSISNPKYAGREFDILLLMKSVGAKQIVFYKTNDWYEKPNKIVGSYIFIWNFLKEYGALPDDPSFPPIHTITEIKQSIEKWRAYQQQIRNKQYQRVVRKPLNPLMIRPVVRLVPMIGYPSTPRKKSSGKRRPRRY